MKLKMQEKIRLIELLGTPIAVGGIGAICTENSVDPNTTRLILKLCTAPYLLNFLTALRQDTYATDHKELEQLYNTVIDNMLTLMDDLDINDPISIFSSFVYMYRHGYLSYNHTYSYDFGMKDLGKLAGLDLVRGHGVCRSVSSMLTDVYLRSGYNASCMGVDAKNAISHIEKLCDKDKPMTNCKTSKIVSLIVDRPKILPSNNHLITTVSDGKKNFILDPMNDGFMRKGRFGRLLIANDPQYYMVFHHGISSINKALGQIKSANFVYLHNQLQMPTIDYDEYKEIYLETLRLCQTNIDLFDDFYHDNSPTYNEIYERSENINGVIGRMTGLGVVGDDIKKLKKQLNFNEKI